MISIGEAHCNCPHCIWSGSVSQCIPDIDGDGSLGCPVCKTVIIVSTVPYYEWQSKLETGLRWDAEDVELMFKELMRVTGQLTDLQNENKQLRKDDAWSHNQWVEAKKQLEIYRRDNKLCPHGYDDWDLCPDCRR